MAEPAADRVRVSGPLAAFADGFFMDLVEQGYRLWPAQRHLELLASVSRWMEAEGLGVEELTSRAVERCVAERRRVRRFGRRLVLAARAPYKEMSPGGVTAVLMRACKRAGSRLSGIRRGRAPWYSIRSTGLRPTR